MRTSIDTNVVSALWSGEELASEVEPLLSEARDMGGLAIAAPVFAELLAHPKASLSFLEDFLHETEIEVDFQLEESVWRMAASVFADYAKRRRQSHGGSPKRLLTDYIIGAHAWLQADRLLTLDKSVYKRAFPELVLLP